ncbi:thioredoxin family protein [Sinanaerobacter sp. ZZT-01]|uniref:thioredoxin family protein n=1 Tax=Sinanaerobacter sp. ZZT-01 TaxID=3111540 RepID=UPI002D7999AB|nr:thioredoxin family protein [Sinanaerobacter sp. ZZT-01]WRR93321.1 thioredoxin family protein [Sinanaerobacter sp. ZZT-01]
MQAFKNYKEVKEAVSECVILLIFAKSENCTVCEAVLPKVKQLVNEEKIHNVMIGIEDVPEFAGQFSVFTAPTILLFVSGKEVYRQSRFIKWDELNKEIKKWKNAIENRG